MIPTPADELVLARKASGISQEQLWMRYFALGGMSQPLELDAIVHAALSTSAHDRDLVVLALNERLLELGREASIPYSDEPPGAKDCAEAPAGSDHARRADAGEDPEHAALLQRAVDTLAAHDSSMFRHLAQAQKEHAYRDALTGVLQRDAGHDQLERAVEQARRTDQPLVLVFLDVDHLKHTNDTKGHAAGDNLLRALGEALRQSLRSYDIVVRYGGDEFVCVLPHAGLAQAIGRVEQVKARLSATVRGATVSAGLAELRKGDTLDDLLRRADMQMYDQRRGQR